MRTYVTVDVEVDLSDIDTDALVEELESRGGGGYGGGGDGGEDLQSIHTMIKLGNKEAAYAAMYDYIRNKLGVAI